MTSPPGRHRYRPSRDAVKAVSIFAGVIGFASASYGFIQAFGWLRGVLLLLTAAAIVATASAWLFSGPTMKSKPTRGGATFAGLSVVIAIASVAAFVLTHTNDTQRLMEEWDGKFAKDVLNCGHGVEASVPVEGLKPEVIGPDGTPIAQIHLRQYSKRECPPAVWAWVPWDGDPDVMLPVPQGWTIHVVIRRDKTSTRLDEMESNSGQAVQYPISKILIATPEAGCVAVDVFFTNDAGTAPPTPTATTGCVTAD
ncbi:hypothetical protein H7J06_03620 [Mycobacterium hodleri]|uniref:hypothetical protein n=1 Tax=Mycolicibacterium hodleri TaxID=49897 RepID=UPI0021F2EC8A|nr:hypothetical protein [Mycolicibacterium hodleri]MCV7132062.1 hypothetical protein [Mycolicibacterium hodleri]